MSKRTQVYKVNVNEIEERIALFEAVGDTETSKAVRTAMKEFGIPVENERVNVHKAKFDKLAKMMNKSTKK